MGSFRTPRAGGNVVHRIDLGGGARRRPGPQRRSGALRRASGAGAGERRSEALPAEELGPEGANRAREAAGSHEAIRARDVIPAAPPRPEPRVAAEAAALDAAPADPDGAAQSRAAEDAGARRQIDLLERRLAKMARMLEAQEKEVAKVQGAPSEDGLPSIYREVQGLDGDGEEVEQKKALMSRIFEANLDLRKQIIPG